jgi:8-amino-7-oxononanoate synthase
VSPYSQLEDRIQDRIRELDLAGLRRRLQPACGIDFSSNDYLGLANHHFLKRQMADAVLREGCGATASRLLRGERTAFSDVERRFAAFKGTESALYFGSGYAANIGVLTTFVERQDSVLTDEQNHASIVDGIRLSRAKRIKFRHCDLNHLSHLLQRIPEGTQKFLVTESLFSMDGDFAPLAEYASLCRETNTVLIVDEAHAVGIYGKDGTGWTQETATANDVFLTINTAGKAMGVAGAFVAGTQSAIDYLIQRARPFIFSTAPPPSLAAALNASLSVMETEPERRERLLSYSSLLRNLLVQSGLDTGRSSSQILPVVLGDNERACSVAAKLQAAGFDVRALRPPTVPPGTARLRISVNALLDEHTIRQFASALARAVDESPA